MNPHLAKAGGFLDTINGGHLHWSDFRENVLRPFRIQCVAPPKADGFPTTFLARLKAAQKTVGKHDAQRQAWRLDVSAGCGLVSSTVFPPNLVPPPYEATRTLRCMLPCMSREGLPLRSPGTKGTLYELPTANPIYVFGFNMGEFTKDEQAHLNGALHVTGVSVDFAKGEILPSRSLCCPYLAFEIFTEDSEQQIEKARNLCAITGAQCLRGQQNLFHKAFGLQTVSQPSITFTCALNNDIAVLNLHSIGEDGSYNMAALCKFDLQNDEHFNTFQAWIEGIDSWASMYLLPRIQGAVAQLVQSHPTPPPSPSPTSSSSHLSIDTKSTNVLSIISELRRVCPTVSWRHDICGETPINSSVAQCGTPLPTREMRGLALPRPANSACSSPIDGLRGPQRSFRASANMSGLLSPLRTDLPLSGRYLPRSSTQLRFTFSPDDTSEYESDGSNTPVSPCRPPSLSPCSPGPEMPMSSMNPMLVLQRRLEVACTEIQELRTQVDDLQGKLDRRTEILERKIQALSERQNGAEKLVRSEASTPTCNKPWTKNLEDIAEQDLRTPRAVDTFPSEISGTEPEDESTLPPPRIPGDFETGDDTDEVFQWFNSGKGKDLAIWNLATILRNTCTQLYLLTFLLLIIGYGGMMNIWDVCTNVFTVSTVNDSVTPVLLGFYGAGETLYEAVSDSTLEPKTGKWSELCGSDTREAPDGNNRTEGGEPMTECVPIVLC